MRLIFLFLISNNFFPVLSSNSARIVRKMFQRFFLFSLRSRVPFLQMGLLSAAQIHPIQSFHISFSFYGLIPRKQLPRTMQMCPLSAECCPIGTQIWPTHLPSLRKLFSIAKSKCCFSNLKSALSHYFYLWSVPDESALDYAFPYEHSWGCAICVCPVPTGSWPLSSCVGHWGSVHRGLLCFVCQPLEVWVLLNYSKARLFGLSLTFFICGGKTKEWGWSYLGNSALRMEGQTLFLTCAGEQRKGRLNFLAPIDLHLCRVKIKEEREAQKPSDKRGPGHNRQRVLWAATSTIEHKFLGESCNITADPITWGRQRRENSEEVREKRPRERVINRGHGEQWGSRHLSGEASRDGGPGLCKGFWLTFIIAFRAFKLFYSPFEISPSIWSRPSRYIRTCVWCTEA